ncbi:MAG: sugar phosphate isomerase/epimerase [Acidobacteria bacterium]|nr:sugar phosphate isomerase/epimerase [Acidobacteriota bacterium]
MASKPFGISTHAFYGERLSGSHIERLKREPFTHIEIFCALHHFDFHDRRQVEEVAATLGSTGLRVNSLHSPFYTLNPSGERAYYSISSVDEDERRFAVSEIKSAMELRSRFAYDYVVVHLGPTGERHRFDDRQQGIRSLTELLEYGRQLGVEIAVENIPNSFSTTDALLDLRRTLGGIVFCFDSGHANMEGDPLRTIEILGPGIRTTHLHDNAGRHDEHRVPYEGSVPWEGVLRALGAQSYPGVYMLEVREGRDEDIVPRAAAAARRMAAMS